MAPQSEKARTLETVEALRAFLARASDASDSDSSIIAPTNRGNKLKRKASFVQEGQLSNLRGPATYRRKVDHGGFTRAVIFQPAVPPAIRAENRDSDETESDEDEENPYADIKLEKVFAPLTKVEDLYKHPSLHRPFYDEKLEYLSNEAGGMMRKEKDALYSMERIFENLLRDAAWVPSETKAPYLTPEQAEEWFPTDLPELDEPIENMINDHSGRSSMALMAMDINENDTSMVNGQSPSSSTKSRAVSEDPSPRGRARTRPGDVPIGQAEVETRAGSLGDSFKARSSDGALFDQVRLSIESPTPAAGSEDAMALDESENHATVENAREEASPAAESQPSSVAPPPSPVRRMTTRAQAAAESNSTTASNEKSPLRRLKGSASPAASSSRASSVAPYFLPPANIAAWEPIRPPQAAAPSAQSTSPVSLSLQPTLSNDPNASHAATNGFPPSLLPLPSIDAIDTTNPDITSELRTLVQTYSQKQSSIIDLTTTLHSTLLRADRMRQDLLRMTRAQGHLNDPDISDGEDWIDYEDLGVRPPPGWNSGRDVDEHLGVLHGRRRAWKKDDYELVKGMDEEELERLEVEREKGGHGARGGRGGGRSAGAPISTRENGVRGGKKSEGEDEEERVGVSEKTLAHVGEGDMVEEFMAGGPGRRRGRRTIQ